MGSFRPQQLPSHTHAVLHALRLGLKPVKPVLHQTSPHNPVSHKSLPVVPLAPHNAAAPATITHWLWELQPAGQNPLATTTPRHWLYYSSESTPQPLSQVSTDKWVATSSCVIHTSHVCLTHRGAAIIAANPAVMQADPTPGGAVCMSSCIRPIHTPNVSGPTQRGEHTPTGPVCPRGNNTQGPPVVEGQHSTHSSCTSGCQPAPFSLKLQAALRRLFLLHHTSHAFLRRIQTLRAVCASSTHQHVPSGVVLAMLQLLMM